MAIRRCPYCKAIIDEKEKFCNNCGTQLLFPEDEMVEEEIPGEKIVDEEEAEEAERVEETPDEEIEEGKLSGGERAAGESVEEKAETEGDEEEEEEGEELEPELEDEEETGELREQAESKEPESHELEGRREETQESSKQAAEKKYQASLEEDELIFKTKELENLTRDVREGEEDLEKFLSTYKKEKQETPVILEEEGEKEEPPAEAREDLPPWATGMKDARSSDELEPEGRAQKEPSATGPEWTTDSGIGIPEKLTQPALPFAETGALKKSKEETMEGDEGSALARGFSLKLKAKLVDLVFITALWLISLWFTAEVIGVSFFRLIVGTPVPVLAFYLILLVLYFFLFLYFLGETLGDHYFSEED